MKLSSKAQTLNNLKIKGAIIPKLKIIVGLMTDGRF